MNDRTDIERRLRQALSATVAGVQPPANPMQMVRAQHLRRRARLAITTVIAAAAAIVGIASAGVFSPGGGPTERSTHPVADLAFPGGGRVLLADGNSLKWLYPDGHAVQIATGFAGAQAQGNRLIAWKSQGGNGFDYYTMNLDGSAEKLVLAAETQQQYLDLTPELSPDGSRLVYIRQAQGPNGATTASAWWIDLTTGRRQTLGPVLQSTIIWKDNATLLATAPDAKSLVALDLNNGSRSTYLSVTDTQLVSSYMKARPTVGPPAFIHADGFSPNATPATLAVWLAAAGPGGSFTQPAEALISPGQTRMLAPPTQQQLDFTWGPKHLFLIQVGVVQGTTPSKTYVGSIDSDKLSAPYGTGDIGPAVINPHGNVMALQDSDIVRFATIPVPSCDNSGHCPTGAPEDSVGHGPTLAGQGTIVDWRP